MNFPWLETWKDATLIDRWCHDADMPTDKFGHTHGCVYVYRAGNIVMKRVDRRLDVNDHHRWLFKEFQILSQLSHPHIIKAYSYVLDVNDCVLYLEYGGEEYSTVRTSLTHDEKWRIYYQIEEAVRYLYGKGFSHRDLVASNVVVNRQTLIAKLIDFQVCVRHFNHVLFEQSIAYAGFGDQPVSRVVHCCGKQPWQTLLDLRRDMGLT